MERKNLFDAFEDSCAPVNNTFADFTWTAKGIGFGYLRFYLGKDGIIHCDSESMNKQFIKNMLCKMVDDCVFDT